MLKLATVDSYPSGLRPDRRGCLNPVLCVSLQEGGGCFNLQATASAADLSGLANCWLQPSMLLARMLRWLSWLAGWLAGHNAKIVKKQAAGPIDSLQTASC